MNCGILTPERLERFMEDQLTPEESEEIQHHLVAPCPACTEFLSEMGEDTEERLREALEDEIALQTVAAIPSDQLFKAILREVKRKPAVPAWRRWLGSILETQWFRPALLGALTSMLLVAGITLFYRSAPVPVPTEKGAETVPASFHIEFAVGHREPDGRLAMTRSVIGETYSRSETLFLRFKMGGPGFVYLLGVGEDGRASLLYATAEEDHGRPRPVGIYDVLEENEAGGIPLKNVKGRYAVIGVYSSVPLDLERRLIPIAELFDLKSGRFSHMGSSFEGMALDAVYFNVGS
jgi:hypothetical protein